MLEELKRTFRPEFLNRVDELIVFHPLDEENILRIAGLMVQSVAARLAERDIHLTWDDEALQFLAKEGFDPTYGARPLRRAIQRMVEDDLSEEILSGRVALGDQGPHVRAGGQAHLYPGTRRGRLNKTCAPGTRKASRARTFLPHQPCAAPCLMSTYFCHLRVRQR